MDKRCYKSLQEAYVVIGKQKFHSMVFGRQQTASKFLYNQILKIFYRQLTFYKSIFKDILDIFSIWKTFYQIYKNRISFRILTMALCVTWSSHSISPCEQLNLVEKWSFLILKIAPIVRVDFLVPKSTLNVILILVLQNGAQCIIC